MHSVADETEFLLVAVFGRLVPVSVPLVFI